MSTRTPLAHLTRQLALTAQTVSIEDLAAQLGASPSYIARLVSRGQLKATTPLSALVVLRRDEILQLASKHGLHEVRVFGSVARGDEDTRSDVDFLVTAKDRSSSAYVRGVIGFGVDAETVLGVQVDVLPEHSVRESSNDDSRVRILAEAIPI